MKLNDEDKAILEQWLEDQSFLNWAKQSDDKDIAKWEHYFNIHPHHWKLAKAGKAIVLGIPFRQISSDKVQGQKALSKLLQRIESRAKPETKLPNTKIRRLWRSWQVAASIAVLMLVSGIIYFQFFHHSDVILATGYGQQLETQLPDGSKVTLNANSKLKYHSQNPRIVWLEGEAFFEVEKKPETDENFQVFTSDLKVTVLGTSFNVNARNDQTKVFLEEGKVKLEVDDPQAEVIQMDPGDLVTYSKKENQIQEKKRNASTLENASWKEGALMFKDTPLPKALFEIEDIYGIQFVMQSEGIKEEEISGGVPIRDLKVTLTTLREVYGLQIRAEGKRYFISKKKD